MFNPTNLPTRTRAKSSMRQAVEAIKTFDGQEFQSLEDMVAQGYALTGFDGDEISTYDDKMKARLASLISNVNKADPTRQIRTAIAGDVRFIFAVPVEQEETEIEQPTQDISERLEALDESRE